MEKHAREFRGKTELDIEAQFSRWQQANAGLVFIGRQRQKQWASALPVLSGEVPA